MHDPSPALSDVTDTEYNPSFVAINRDCKHYSTLASGPPQKNTQLPSTDNLEYSSAVVGKDTMDSNIMVKTELEETKPGLTPRKKRGMSTSPSKVRKASASPSKSKRTIATSLSEASAEDKLMVYLKEEEHKPWGEIAAAIEKLTGNSASEKSLSKRYSRLKRNFGAKEFDDEDMPYVLQCKQEIEAKFQNELYVRIAEALTALGRPQYPAAVIKKKVQGLTKKDKSCGMEKSPFVEA
ncbi:hypothetical protein KEM56_001085 [Ascosphaera pollenicola]|nr:hypothetical protein KEM56_001085 [Ascosphaera pollenicola]